MKESSSLSKEDLSLLRLSTTRHHASTQATIASFPLFIGEIDSRNITKTFNDGTIL